MPLPHCKAMLNTSIWMTTIITIKLASTAKGIHHWWCPRLQTKQLITHPVPTKRMRIPHRTPANAKAKQTSHLSLHQILKKAITFQASGPHMYIQPTPLLMKTSKIPKIHCHPKYSGALYLPIFRTRMQHQHSVTAMHNFIRDPTQTVVIKPTHIIIILMTHHHMIPAMICWTHHIINQQP